MIIKEIGWEDFKNEVSSFRSRYIYRGQSNSVWSLHSSFHRSLMSKSDWDFYFQEVVFEATHRLADKGPDQFRNLLNNVLDSDTPLGHKDFWVCLQFLQHHGFPTPILDWTESPYIAAYFAFRNAVNMRDGSVAIFAFDHTGPLLFQLPGTPNDLSLNKFEPGIAICRCNPIGNPRSISQQSVMMFTKYADIEGAVVKILEDKYAHKSQYHNRIFTKYIISVGETKKALEDLDKMNVNGTTIWNDVSGICEHLRISAELKCMKP